MDLTSESGGEKSKTGTRPPTDYRLYGFAVGVVKPWIRCQYGLEAIGAENVPKEGGLLVVPNHASFLDICVLACTTSRRLTFVMRENLLDIPVLGFLIRHWGPILLRRGSTDLTAMREIVEALEAGKAVVIFPEGTRTRDGELGPLQRGVLFAAKRARVPLLPVGIAGNFGILPRTRKFPRMRGRMVVAYGAPLDVQGGGDRQDVDGKNVDSRNTDNLPADPLERVRAAILREMARARELWSKREGKPFPSTSIASLSSALLENSTPTNSGSVVSTPSTDGGHEAPINP